MSPQATDEVDGKPYNGASLPTKKCLRNAKKRHLFILEKSNHKILSNKFSFCVDKHYILLYNGYALLSIDIKGDSINVWLNCPFFFSL